MDNLEEMDKFLERYNFPSLNKKELENINKPITSNEAETVIKNFPTNKSPGPDGYIGKFYQTLREERSTIILKLFQNNCRGRSMPKLVLRGHHHPDTKTRKRDHRKQNYRPISLMNIDTKILNKILANRIQQHLKRIIHHDQVGFIPGMQGFFNVCKSMCYTILTN